MHSAPVELLPSNAIFWLGLRVLCSSGSLLSNGDGNGNENVKKSDRLGWAKQQLCMCITCITLLCRYWTTTTWNSLKKRFMKDISKRRQLFLSPCKLGCSPWEFNSGKFNYIWDFTRLGIIARKFEKGEAFFNEWRFHWLSRRRCWSSLFNTVNTLLLLKPHANGRINISQQLPTLLDVTCCFHLHTLLHVVACC